MRFLRRNELYKKVGFGKDVEIRLRKQGLFPEPVKATPDSTLFVWIEEEVDRWMAQRVADHRNLTPAE